MDDPTPSTVAATAAEKSPDAKTASKKHAANREAASSLDAAFLQMLLPLHRSLVSIEKRLKNAAVTAAAGEAKNTPVTAGGDQLLTVMNQRFDQLTSEVNDLSETTARLIAFQEFAQKPPAVSELVDASESSLNDCVWEQIILGEDLCNDDSLDDVRTQLMDDVLAGNPSARALAGQMLLAHSAITEEYPDRLRLVGEAFYAWRPRSVTGDDLFESALAASLTRRAEALGLPHSIQLVLPGARYDNSRHVASIDGIEVVAIHGWIVVRDQRDVYTKASVIAR